MERVLRDIGQFLRPMSEAPRDSQMILGHVAHSDGMIYCYWETKPTRLAGPSWVKTKGATQGYLDRYFSGWLDPSIFSPPDDPSTSQIAQAYVDNARETRDEQALKILDAPATEDEK